MLIADIAKLDPRNKRASVKGYDDFVDVMTQLRDRSTFADTISETRDLYAMTDALIGVGKSNGVFRY